MAAPQVHAPLAMNLPRPLDAPGANAQAPQAMATPKLLVPLNADPQVHAPPAMAAPHQAAGQPAEGGNYSSEAFDDSVSGNFHPDGQGHEGDDEEHQGHEGDDEEHQDHEGDDEEHQRHSHSFWDMHDHDQQDYMATGCEEEDPWQ